MQRVLRAYRYLSSRAPERVESVRIEVERYAKDVERAGVTGRELSRSYPPSVVARYAFGEGLSLLVGLPLALWGMANHIIPYRLTGAVVRWLRRTAEEEATDKLAAGMVLYPLSWIVEGCVAWWLTGGWGLALFTVSLIPTGFFALTWQERLGRFGREARGFFQFLGNRDLRRRLLARRRALLDHLAALAQEVTPSVLKGAVPET